MMIVNTTNSHETGQQSHAFYDSNDENATLIPSFESDYVSTGPMSQSETIRKLASSYPIVG
jgi:hypothetical protein